MKAVWIGVVLLLISLSVYTNGYGVRSLNSGNRLFIITLDGFRWQEVFGGADSSLINDTRFNADVSLTKALYWAPTPEERRKKLLPFFWNLIAQQGELFGNRRYQNKANVANPYALSYPGYNELLTGYVDYTVFSNGKSPNHNPSVLDLLNASSAYSGKVAAFTSWDAFPFILNKNKSAVYLNSGFQNIEGNNLSAGENQLNRLQDEVEDQKATRYDELTYISCKEYIQKRKPAVVFLSFGGTDEAAHSKNYDQYLQQANNADRMIGELWHYIQTVPEYAGKTSFLITTDHGRGGSSTTWNTHGILINGSSQTWLALLGHKVPATGENKTTGQLYQKDLKNKMLQLLAD